MSYFPQGYKVPQAPSKYLKFKEGENKFRILAPVVMGWEDWKEEGGVKKPVRYPYNGDASRPEPINPKRAVKHFWAFPIFDYADNTIKILEITQAGIQSAILNYHLDPDFGDPRGYDIVVKRTGKDLETEYNILAKPPKEMSEEIKKLWAETKVDCNKLLTNEDPFDVKEGVATEVTIEVANEELENLVPDIN